MKQLILNVIVLLCLSACTKEKQHSDPPKGSSVKITDYFPKKATDGDTLTFLGSFPSDKSEDYSITFSNEEGTMGASANFVSTEKMSVIVPDLHEYATQTLKFTISIHFKGDYYEASADSLFNFKSKLIYVNFFPKEARPGQLVTLSFKFPTVKTSNYASLKVRFAGTNEWHVPVGQDSFFNYGAHAAGPLIRIPSNAVSGSVEIIVNETENNISDSTLTILPAMPEPQSGVWTQIADFAARGANGDETIGNGRSGAIAFTIDEKVYVGCGASLAPFDEFGSKEMWEYDPKYNSWMQIPGFPGRNRTYPVAFTIDGKGYVGTGLDKNGNPTKDFWQYDPKSNSWTRLPDFPGMPRSNAVGFAVSGEGYVGTGIGTNDTAIYGDMYRYNPTSNSWTQISSIAEKRTEAYAFVIGNTAYIGGGHGRDKAINDLQSFNPGSGSWTQKASIPNYSYLSSNASFVINGKGYVGLGRDKTQPIIVGNTQVFEYTPSTNSWTAIPNMNKDRTSSVGFSVNGVGYMGMGRPIGGLSSIQDIWAYKP